jgi:hypothetical protein
MTRPHAEITPFFSERSIAFRACPMDSVAAVKPPVRADTPPGESRGGLCQKARGHTRVRLGTRSRIAAG